jgi:hypothetical protein
MISQSKVYGKKNPNSIMKDDHLPKLANLCKFLNCETPKIQTEMTKCIYYTSVLVTFQTLTNG